MASNGQLCSGKQYLLRLNVALYVTFFFIIFFQLGGITTCLKVIASAYDWTFQGRCEMVRSALDILTVAAILPKVQLQLCEKVPLPDDTKPVGMSILLGASEGEIVQESAEVQRAALGVLISCVCAPGLDTFC